MASTKIALNDGKKIPALGFGNGTSIYSKSEKATEGTATAIAVGFRHVDTAQFYETEVQTGKGIKQSGVDRKDIWVTSKLSANKFGKNTFEDLKKAVDETIENLGFKPDLFLIHNPFVGGGAGDTPGGLAKLWQGLEKLVADGTLAGVSLGVSNFRPKDLNEVLGVAKIKPVINQVEYHPYVLAHLDPIRKIQDEHNIVFQAYGPLTPILRHPTGGPLKPRLQTIAKRLSKDSGHEVDEAAVLLKWTIQTGVSAVSTSSKKERLAAIVDVDTLPELTRDEVNEIERIGRKIHYRFYKMHLTKEFPAPDLPEDIDQSLWADL